MKQRGRAKQRMSASCAITNMQQTWVWLYSNLRLLKRTQDLQQLGQAQALMAVEDEEENGKEEGSSNGGEDWFKSDENDAE
eukprot:1139412-Pelagomonas_calceolata.AAC.5